ncbi:MAG TPA: hypothetical protein VFF61_10700 [Microvirga sp.]|nr:hypothetical protein [Microvirga sp.]
MKPAALILVVLGAFSISAAGYALTPLSEEQIKAIRREWRAAPIHVQAEVISSHSLPNRDWVKCGRINAVVRRTFKGEELLPIGSSFSVEHCLPPDIDYTTFQMEFERGRLMEILLEPDAGTSAKVVVRNGLKSIRALSEEAQLPWMR